MTRIINPPIINIIAKIFLIRNGFVIFSERTFGNFLEIIIVKIKRKTYLAPSKALIKAR